MCKNVNILQVKYIPVVVILDSEGGMNYEA